MCRIIEKAYAEKRKELRIKNRYIISFGTPILRVDLDGSLRILKLKMFAYPPFFFSIVFFLFFSFFFLGKKCTDENAPPPDPIAANRAFAIQTGQNTSQMQGLSSLEGRKTFFFQITPQIKLLTKFDFGKNLKKTSFVRHRFFQILKYLIIKMENQKMENIKIIKFSKFEKSISR